MFLSHSLPDKSFSVLRDRFETIWVALASFTLSFLSLFKILFSSTSSAFERSAPKKKACPWGCGQCLAWPYSGLANYVCSNSQRLDPALNLLDDCNFTPPLCSPWPQKRMLPSLHHHFIHLLYLFIALYRLESTRQSNRLILFSQ